MPHMIKSSFGNDPHELAAMSKGEQASLLGGGVLSPFADDDSEEGGFDAVPPHAMACMSFCVSYS